MNAAAPKMNQPSSVCRQMNFVFPFLQGKNRAVKIDIIHSSILNTVLIMTNDDLLLIILNQAKSRFRQDKIDIYSYN